MIEVGSMKPKRVALYMRVSSLRQANKNSIESQRNELWHLCERHDDWQVTEYVDRAISGTKESRPELDRLMSDCRKGGVDMVVCWKFDRIARSVSHLLRTLEELRALDVE